MLTTQRVLDQVPLIPAEGALGGWAAAFVQGVDWLDGVDRRGVLKVPVHVGGPAGRSSSGCRFVHDRLEEHEVVVHEGLRVTTLGRTAFDAARWSSDLTDAVVALDAVLAHSALTGSDLEDEVRRRPWWPGVRRVREALARADGAVLSAAESRLRVLYTDEAQLPRPLVNPWIYDRSWNVIGRPDLLDPVVGHVTEYDGAYHLTDDQPVKDDARREKLERLGLKITRVVADDLADQHALARLLKRDHLTASLRPFDRSSMHIVQAGADADLEGIPVPPGAASSYLLENRSSGR